MNKILTNTIRNKKKKKSGECDWKTGQMHTQGKLLLGNDTDLTEKLQNVATHVNILRKCGFIIEG